MSFKKFLEEHLDLPIVSVSETGEIQKDIDINEEDLEEAKTPEDRFAKDMIKLIKKHALERGIENIRTVLMNMMDKVR